MFQHELAFFPGNFKAVGARCLTGPGDTPRCATSVIFQKRIGLVFRLNRLILPQSDVSRDTHGKPYKPLQEIEIMWALVDEPPASLPLPCGAPGAGLIVRLGTEPIR